MGEWHSLEDEVDLLILQGNVPLYPVEVLAYGGDDIGALALVAEFGPMPEIGGW